MDIGFVRYQDPVFDPEQKLSLGGVSFFLSLLVLLLFVLFQNLLCSHSKNICNPLIGIVNQLISC